MHASSPCSRSHVSAHFMRSLTLNTQSRARGPRVVFAYTRVLLTHNTIPSRGYFYSGFFLVSSLSLSQSNSKPFSFFAFICLLYSAYYSYCSGCIYSGCSWCCCRYCCLRIVMLIFCMLAVSVALPHQRLRLPSALFGRVNQIKWLLI